jgi:signal peptidase
MMVRDDVGAAVPRGRPHDATTVPRSPRSALRRAVVVMLVAVAALTIAPTLLAFGGFRSLVVRSGSMEPALMTGDVILSHSVQPSSLHVGDIVTFVDATRDNVLVTHRVVEVHRLGPAYSFVTRGDMNTGVERWSIDATGTVGRLALRVPRFGFVVAWIAQPQVRAVLLLAALMPLATSVLRRIWSR